MNFYFHPKLTVFNILFFIFGKEIESQPHAFEGTNNTEL